MSGLNVAIILWASISKTNFINSFTIIIEEQFCYDKKRKQSIFMKYVYFIVVAGPVFFLYDQVSLLPDYICDGTQVL